MVDGGSLGLPSHLLDKGLATLCLDHVAGLLCRRPRPEAFVVFAERVFFRVGCLVGAQVLIEGNLEVRLLQTLIAAVAEWSASTVRDGKVERREWETDGRGGWGCGILWQLGRFGEFRQFGFAKLLQVGKAGRHGGFGVRFESGTMRLREWQLQESSVPEIAT